MAKINLTSQEMFDKVVAHARKQKVRAMDGRGMCLYRALNGNKCFVGALIPDELYEGKIEGQGIRAVINHYPGLFDPTHSPFLCRLQEVHDVWPPERWEYMFMEAAMEYNLKYTPPEVDDDSSKQQGSSKADG